MPTQLPAPVRGVIDAANNGDTAAFLDQFAPGIGYVTDWGREVRGIDAISRWSNAEFIGKAIKLDIITFYRTDDDEIVVIAQLHNNGSSTPYTFTFQLADDRLAAMHINA